MPSVPAEQCSGFGNIETRRAVAGIKPDAKYAKPMQFAVISGISYKTLEAMRARRKGPPFLKVGSRVLYPIEPGLAWLESHRVGGAA